MPPTPPREKEALTLNWDLDDEGAGATREMETDELFALRGFLEESAPPAAVDVAPAPPTTRSTSLQIAFEETEPVPNPASTVRPEVPQDEYVNRMMRLAPPSSEAKETPLRAAGLDEGFDMLTPWPASVVPEADPSAIEYMNAELGSLGSPVLPRAFEDLGEPAASFGEVDLADIVPEFGEVVRTKRQMSPVPGEALDEIDEMLLHEAIQARRRRTEIPPARHDTSTEFRVPEVTVEETDAELAFDDPAFQPPSEAGVERALSLLEMPSAGLEEAYSETSFAVDDGGAPEPSQEEMRTRVVQAPLADVIEPAPDTVQDLGAVYDVFAARTESAPPDRLAGVRARFEIGDFKSTLVLAEAILDEEPGHLAAKCYADACRALLLQMYLGRIGDKAGVPRVVMPPEQMTELLFDGRAGFLLSCMDGVSTVEEVLDVCGMDHLDALRILYELLQEGVIEVASPSLRRGRYSRRPGS